MWLLLWITAGVVVSSEFLQQMEPFCPEECECFRKDVRRVVDCSGMALSIPPEGLDQIPVILFLFSVSDKLMG